MHTISYTIIKYDYAVYNARFSVSSTRTRFLQLTAVRLYSQRKRDIVQETSEILEDQLDKG